MIYTADNCLNANVYELLWKDERPTLELCKRYVYSVDTDDNTVEYYATTEALIREEVEYYATTMPLIREKVKTLKVLELPDSSFIFIVEFLNV